MADDALRFPVEVDPNEAQIASAGTETANTYSRAVERGIDRSGLGKRIQGSITKSIEKAAVSGKVFDPFKTAAADAAESLSPLERRLEDTTRDVAALNERIGATRRTLTQIGAEPGLFAKIDRELERIAVNMRDFEQEIRGGAADPVRLAGLEAGIRESNKVVFREIAGIQSTLRNLSRIQATEGNRANAAADRINQERLLNARQAHGRFIAQTQREGAQILAETRLTGQKQLQDERQRSRARIEIARFTLRQIQVLERGFAGLFRATGTILNTTVGAVGGTLNRLGALFRRSDRDMNDGLRGALLRREQSLGRSFSRQTESVRRETLEQSRIIQRFETQASTGLAGAVTGRSSLGALFGGGLAFGGGFAAFQGLRNGIRVGGDFVQGLSVLGAQLELTEEQMAAVRQQSIDLGNDISLPGVSALDAAAAIQLLAKQFANLGDAALPAAQGAAKGVLQLSRAVGVEADEAARVVGAAVNVFRVEADSAVAVADQITNALTKSAGVGFGDFADAFTQSAGVVRLFTGEAAASEQVLAEFNAAIAVLAKNGLIGSDAGTSLKQFFLQANRGTKDATKVLDQIIAAAGESGSVFFDAAGGARTLAESLDILRRGTADLNNQQLTTALGKLFGSDAARAAAFLIDTTAAEFDGLVDSILRSGSAADIAAAQNVGLRGALDALGSVIETQQIKTYERYQEVLGRVVLRFADLLNAFFEGRGRLGQLRTALTGVAVALGGLLVAKAVGEAFQFMAIGLRAALGPLGLLVTGLAALGGAVAVLREVSPEFRVETNLLADSLRQRLANSAEFVGDVLARVSAFVRTEVVPRFIDFANVVASRIAPALDAAGRFLIGTVVPVLRRAAEIITSIVAPAFAQLATIITTEVVPRLQAAIGFVRDVAAEVAPLIQPAIDGFAALSSAIQAAFSEDDTSGLLPALVRVRDGLLASLNNVGGALVDLLGPQLERVVDFIARQFAPRNMERVVRAFAPIAFRIGETLGSVISNPRVVAALEGIIAALAATAVLALAGFVKGVSDNLPELGDMLVKQFQFVFNQVFSDGIDFAEVARFVVVGIAGAIGAVALGTALIQSFRRPVDNAMTTVGQRGGRTFIRSFGSTLRTGFTGSLNNPFARGLFGGIDRLERDAANAARRAGDAVIAEQANFARRLKLLGRTIEFIPLDDGALAADTRRQFEELQQRLGPQAIAGASFRASLTALRADVSTAFAGIGTAISGNIGEGFRIASGAASSFGRNLRDFVRNTITDMKAAGIGLGQALGGAIVSGVGAALSGQQLGSADSRFGQGLGLAGIIASSLFAGASVGGGPLGVAVGGVVATVGLLSAAFSRSGESARIAAEQVAGYRDVLAQFNSIAQATEGLSDQLTRNLEASGRGVQDFLTGTNIQARDLINEFADGTFTASENFDLLTRSVGINTDAFNAYGGSIDAARQALESGVPLAETIGPEAQVINDLIDQFDRLGIDARTFFRTFDALSAQFDRFGSAAQFERFSQGFNPNRVEETTTAIDDAVDSTSRLRAQQERYVEQLIRAAGASPGLDTAAERQAERIRINTDNIATAIGNLNQARTDQIQGRIADLTTEIEGLRTVADLALEDVLGLVNNPLADPFQAGIDQLLLGVGQVGQQLQEQLAQGIDIGAVLGDQTAIGAQVRGIVEPFATAFQAAVARAVTDNPGISTDALRAKFQPVFDEIASGRITVPVEVEVPDLDEAGNQIGSHLETQQLQVEIPESAQQILTDTLNSLLENPALELGLQNVLVANEAIADAQRQLEEANLELGVRVAFSATQIQEELNRLGLSVPLGSIFGFLDQAAAAESQARARALADQTPQERRENPLPPVVNFNQTVNQTISGGSSPQATADASARSNRTAAVQGIRPILAGSIS